MRVFKIGMVVATLGMAGLPLVTGCSQSDGQGEQEQAGTLSLNLTGTSSLGARYRLSDGSFAVSGPKSVTLSTETDPDATSIRTELPAQKGTAQSGRCGRPETPHGRH